VALSGGPDSTALVHLLTHLSRSHSWDVQAAHFDHGLRPDSCLEAEELSDRIDKLGVQLHLGRSAERLRAAHAPMRRARYAWLESVASEIGADRIATGHNLDDQAETILFRVLRGTGNRGLTGIPTHRENIVRPMLGFTADEIRDWLKHEGLDAVEDPSNQDIRWARNRIRHQLIPSLEAHIGIDVRERLLAISAAAATVERTSLRIAGMALAAANTNSDEISRVAMLSWPVPLRAEMLRLAARERDVRLTRGAAKRAASVIGLLCSGHGLDLGGGLRIEREFDVFKLGLAQVETRRSGQLLIPGFRSGRAILKLGAQGYRVRWGPDIPSPALSGRVALSVHREHYPLTVRGWEAGDRIRLHAGSRKLKRVFGEARIPVSARNTIPIVTDCRGNVLWVAGLIQCADGNTAQNTELVIEIEDV